MSDDRPTDLPEDAASAVVPASEPEVAAAPASELESGPEREPDEATARPPRSTRRTRTGSARDARSASPQRAARARTPLPSSATAVRRRLRVAFSLLGIVVLAGGFGVWSTLYRATANVPPGRPITVTIARGASGDQIATQLANVGVVANPTMFRLRATMLGANGKLKPGTYTLATGSSYEGVIAALTRGPLIEYITVTIPEGWGIDKTAARMQEKLGIPAVEFIKLATTGAKQFDFAFLADDPTPTLEGYLFPKTYDFKKGVKAAGVIRIMLTQYGIETAGLDYSYSKSKGLTPHDVLAIASIIEREAQVTSDRPKVASVIYNRLAIGMRLQLDSTVQYALNGKAKLTLNDLKTDSPYNTYFYKGLPPGPICSPGMSAIKAAAHPAKTNYLYYILTHKGGSQSFTSSYSVFLQLKNQLAKKGLQ
jgi:UPF0755 protein